MLVRVDMMQLRKGRRREFLSRETLKVLPEYSLWDIGHLP
jgi:hypothetical protein